MGSPRVEANAGMSPLLVSLAQSSLESDSNRENMMGSSSVLERKGGVRASSRAMGPSQLFQLLQRCDSDSDQDSEERENRSSRLSSPEHSHNDTELVLDDISVEANKGVHDPFTTRRAVPARVTESSLQQRMSPELRHNTMLFQPHHDTGGFETLSLGAAPKPTVQLSKSYAPGAVAARSAEYQVLFEEANEKAVRYEQQVRLLKQKLAAIEHEFEKSQSKQLEFNVKLHQMEHQTRLARDRTVEAEKECTERRSQVLQYQKRLYETENQLAQTIDKLRIIETQQGEYFEKWTVAQTELERMEHEWSYQKERLEKYQKLATELNDESERYKTELDDASVEIKARDRMLQDQQLQLQQKELEQSEHSLRQLQTLQQQLQVFKDNETRLQDELQKLQLDKHVLRIELQEAQRTLSDTRLQLEESKMANRQLMRNMSSAAEQSAATPPKDGDSKRTTQERSPFTVARDQRREESPVISAPHNPPVSSNGKAIVATRSPTPTPMHYTDYMETTRKLDEQLRRLAQEKEQLHAEYSRFPVHGGNLAMRRRKSEVDARLDEIDRVMSSLRMQLKQLYAL